jgi:hypothetical protein
MDKLIDISGDYNAWVVHFSVSVWAVIFLFAGWLIFKLWNYAQKNAKIPSDITETEITYKIGEQEVKYKIVRNYLNIEIAHRIYVELITRKAAIPIDENNDVIVEVYNSWYALFGITRDEIKKLSGSLIDNNTQSDQLIKLTTDILNIGLRPHLTQYQAKFRKWYAKAEKETTNENKTPQQIQAEYPEFNDLVLSVKEVNRILIEYSEQLHKFIKGKEEIA